MFPVIVPLELISDDAVIAPVNVCVSAAALPKVVLPFAVKCVVNEPLPANSILLAVM